MEKIRIGNDNVYRIEVNDKGECIEFDLLDIELPMKLINASERLKEEKEKHSERMETIKNGKADGAEVIKKQYEVDKEFCNTMREILDELFGKGASQKIFGDVNRIDMFDDFFTQLEPHLDKIVINIEKIKKDLVKKYKLTEDKI